MESDMTQFAIYVGALGLSGLLLLVLAIFGIGNRAINGIIGLAGVGYAGYLIYQFLTAEGEFAYTQFLYAYILPVIAVFQLYKGLKDRKAEQVAPAAPVPAPEG